MNDTAKLNLILEHNREYFANPRETIFIDNAFIEYEIFDTSDGKSLYFTSIFVSKKHRGDGKLVKQLFDIGDKLVRGKRLVSAFARVEKGNKHKGNLIKLYEAYGFRYLKEDEDALYYKVVPIYKD
jgi:hypothetical protein